MFLFAYISEILSARGRVRGTGKVEIYLYFSGQFLYVFYRDTLLYCIMFVVRNVAIIIFIVHIIMAWGK
jgi:hypothetical protein